MSDYSLYGYWRSTSTWRVRIALHWKGIEFVNIPIHLVRDGGEQNEASFAAHNPMAQVPVLKIRTADGEIGLSQSLAIVEYLEETHPEPPLLPKQPVARASARQLAEIVNSGIQPLQNLRVLQSIEALGGAKLDWARAVIERGLAALEQCAAETAGRYLVGDEVSIADVCLIPQLYNARRFDVAVEGFPTLLRTEERCSALDAFSNARPEKQPDAQH